MEEDTKLLKLAEEALERTIKDGLTTNNLDIVYKLAKIKHMEKEDKEMYREYGNYYGGGRPGYDSYGRYDNYGRRGYDAKYRGHEHLDRMYNDYGRYMDSRNRYGASEETDKSYHYMVKALEDFIRVLYEEAETEPQKQMLRETLQRSMM